MIQPDKPVCPKCGNALLFDDRLQAETCPVCGWYDRTPYRSIAQLKRENAELRRERDEARRRLLSAAGDDLCRLTPEEIKELSSGGVKIPPREEFIASCERFHAQLAAGPGVLHNCLTLAQLIAENEKLQYDNDIMKPQLKVITGQHKAACDQIANLTAERDELARQVAEWKTNQRNRRVDVD